MLFQSDWKIKPDRKRKYKRVHYIIAIISLLIGIGMWHLLPFGVVSFIIAVSGSYMILGYIILGIMRCYKIRKFKHHIIFRWAVLSVIALYTIISLLIVIIDGPVDGMLIPWVIDVPLLICAIQSVRNGYIVESEKRSV